MQSKNHVHTLKRFNPWFVLPDVADHEAAGLSRGKVPKFKQPVREMFSGLSHNPLSMACVAAKCPQPQLLS